MNDDEFFAQVRETEKSSKHTRRSKKGDDLRTSLKEERLSIKIK